MITILQEITNWDTHNGIYAVNDHDYLVGYQATLDSEYKEFKNPIKGFSRARRKFEVIGSYPEATDEVDGLTRFEFEGSKGNTYVVTVEDGNAQCTCPGFKFRGNCKHYNAVMEDLK